MLCQNVRAIGHAFQPSICQKLQHSNSLNTFLQMTTKVAQQLRRNGATATKVHPFSLPRTDQNMGIVLIELPDTDEGINPLLRKLIEDPGLLQLPIQPTYLSAQQPVDDQPAITGAPQIHRYAGQLHDRNISLHRVRLMSSEFRGCSSAACGHKLALALSAKVERSDLSDPAVIRQIQQLQYVQGSLSKPQSPFTQGELLDATFVQAILVSRDAVSILTASCQQGPLDVGGLDLVVVADKDMDGPAPNLELKFDLQAVMHSFEGTSTTPADRHTHNRYNPFTAMRKAILFCFNKWCADHQLEISLRGATLDSMFSYIPDSTLCVIFFSSAEDKMKFLLSDRANDKPFFTSSGNQTVLAHPSEADKALMRAERAREGRPTPAEQAQGGQAPPPRGGGASASTSGGAWQQVPLRTSSAARRARTQHSSAKRQRSMDEMLQR